MGLRDFLSNRRLSRKSMPVSGEKATQLAQFIILLASLAGYTLTQGQAEAIALGGLLGWAALEPIRERFRRRNDERVQEVFVPDDPSKPEPLRARRRQ